MKFGNPVDTGLPEVILAWSYWLPTTFKMADWRRFALSFSLWVCSNLRTEFLVEDFFEGNFAHLFEVFLHHAADAGYKHTHTHTHTQAVTTDELLIIDQGATPGKRHEHRTATAPIVTWRSAQTSAATLNIPSEYRDAVNRDISRRLLN